MGRTETSQSFRRPRNRNRARKRGETREIDDGRTIEKDVLHNGLFLGLFLGGRSIMGAGRIAPEEEGVRTA